MHQAVIQARKTVGEFIAALKHPAPGQQDFEVKKPFIQNGQVEEMTDDKSQIADGASDGWTCCSC